MPLSIGSCAQTPPAVFPNTEKTREVCGVPVVNFTSTFAAMDPTGTGLTGAKFEPGSLQVLQVGAC